MKNTISTAMIGTIGISLFLSCPAHAIWTCVTHEEAIDIAASKGMTKGNPLYCRIYKERGQQYDPNMNDDCQVWDWDEKNESIVIRFAPLHELVCVVSEQHIQN